MSERLVFPDAHAAADALTFAGRATRLGDGAVRLRAADGTIVMTAAPLAPAGLLDPTPTVLGMRMLPIDPELECDLVVTASALQLAGGDSSAIELPSTALSPAWAGVSPPRGGWERTDALAASVLAARAQYGMAAVADAVPTDSGEEVVRAVRARVWGASDPQLADLPAGAAFAAFALGFIAGDEQAVVFRSGPWTRVSLVRGHVLVRGPLRSGLTAVRSTGSRGD
jgi:hypothetical protein